MNKKCLVSNPCRLEYRVFWLGNKWKLISDTTWENKKGVARIDTKKIGYKEPDHKL